MKVLILVLSARRDPWDKLMDCQLETWDAEYYPQTWTLFYCGKSDQPSTPKVFYSPALTESLEDVSSRTIEAFEKALELEWDCLARPHSSTYVHKANLVKFCETLPATDVLCGVMTEGPTPFIWGGCHYVFSRDVIERMVAHKDQWNRTGDMEDQAITKMAERLSIPVTPGWSATINLGSPNVCLTYNHGDSFNFTDYVGIWDNLDGHFFVRCKQDLRRHEDVMIMRELHGVLK